MGQERADKLLQNLELLKRKLDLFQIYPVKILRKISDDSYIVTLFGVELIAQSSISFKQKNGLVQVLGFSPSIHLKFINPTYSFDKAYYNFIKQYQIELAPYNQYIFHILSKHPASISQTKLFKSITILQKTFANFDSEGLLPLESVIRYVIYNEKTHNCLTPLLEAFQSKTEMDPKMVVKTIVERMVTKKYEKSCFLDDMLPNKYSILRMPIDHDCSIVIEREEKDMFAKAYLQIQQTKFPKFAMRVTIMDREVTILLFIEQNLLEPKFNDIQQDLSEILAQNGLKLIHLGLEIKPLLSIKDRLNRFNT